MPTIDTFEDLRGRALALLASERRAMHTGELAQLLQAKTSEVHTAMHPAYQTGKVHFSSSEGWSIAPPFTPLQPHDDNQGSL